MKNMDLMTPDLHDFSDIEIRRHGAVALVAVLLLCGGVLYDAFAPAGVPGPGASQASPAITSPVAPTA